jgi:hypothetical protein
VAQGWAFRSKDHRDSAQSWEWHSGLAMTQRLRDGVQLAQSKGRGGGRWRRGSRMAVVAWSRDTRSGVHVTRGSDTRSRVTRITDGTRLRDGAEAQDGGEAKERGAADGSSCHYVWLCFEKWSTK